jgi:4,5-dihydroxyphthalate decarboxylase
MPHPLRLTLACGNYDINRALISGDVEPQGIELTVLSLPSPERHARMSLHAEFDVCELSMATYLMLHDRGESPFVAIPAFPHRRFRHGYIFVNDGAGIREPAQLNGKRIGIRTWQTTAGLWLRGILQDEHGVDLSSISWIAQDEEDVPLPRPDEYRIERVPSGTTVTAMLERGELDALIYPDMPKQALGAASRIKPLFGDSKRAEIEYYRGTGHFPIMHTVVLGRSIVDRHPWVPRNLLDAFRRSKDLAFDSMRDPRSISLAWLREARAEQEEVLGTDPWAYDFESNRATLETMIRYSHEQAMIARRFSADELFVQSSLSELPSYV